MMKRLKHAGTSAALHGPVTRVLHLIGGALVVYGLIFSADFADLSNATVLRRDVLFALALGVFFVCRLLWVTLVGGASQLPSDAPRWEHWLSRAVHYGVYASIFGVVLTGLAIAFLARGPNYGALLPQSTILDVHAAFANGLIALIGLHLCGAAWHWIVRRDGVWEAMVGTIPWKRGPFGSHRST